MPSCDDPAEGLVGGVGEAWGRRGVRRRRPALRSGATLRRLDIDWRPVLGERAGRHLPLRAVHAEAVSGVELARAARNHRERGVQARARRRRRTFTGKLART